MMVDEYNELIRQQVSASADAEESGVSNEMESKLEQWKERADEYSHKFSALAEGGIGELAGMSGLKNTYSKFTETRKKFKKFMGDGENAYQVNPAGSTLNPAQALDKLTSGELSDLIPQSSKDAVGNLVNAVKSVKQKVVDTVSKAPDLARATITDPAKAGAVAVKDSSLGDVNLSADDLDDIVRRNLADVNEGVGREAGALVQNVHGINYGKTGAGADLIADAQQSTSFSAPANLRQSLRAVQGEVSGAVKTSASQPIDVGRLGVKATAKEFDARTEPVSQGIMQQGANPPNALDLQIESAQSKLKETFQQLPSEDRARVIKHRGEANYHKKVYLIYNLYNLSLTKDFQVLQNKEAVSVIYLEVLHRVISRHRFRQPLMSNHHLLKSLQGNKMRVSEPSLRQILMMLLEADRSWCLLVKRLLKLLVILAKQH